MLVSRGNTFVNITNVRRPAGEERLTLELGYEEI
jgi:hypothetical protein